jgi:hypothetical protein
MNITHFSSFAGRASETGEAIPELFSPGVTPGTLRVTTITLDTVGSLVVDASVSITKREFVLQFALTVALARSAGVYAYDPGHHFPVCCAAGCKLPRNVLTTMAHEYCRAA